MNLRFIFLFFSFALPSILFSQTKQECLHTFNGGFCLVKVYNSYGVMKKNKFVIPAYFDTVTEFHSEYFIATQGNKKGVFDKKGKMLVPVMYHAIDYVKGSDGLFEVQSTGIRAIFLRGTLTSISGMSRVLPTVLASQTELTLQEYFSFVQYLKDKNDTTWMDNLPDTNRMDKKTTRLVREFSSAGSSDEALSTTFSWHTQSYSILSRFKSTDFRLTKELLKIPVTGINFEQATRFCEWKTMIYNSQFNTFSGFGIKVKFRLPKINEWEDLATSGLKTDKEKRSQITDSIIKFAPAFFFKTNLTNEIISASARDLGPGPVPAQSFLPDDNSILNLFGNVAEMVNEKGLCKGGSFLHYAKECNINRTQSYNGPQPWLGCRIICEFSLTR
jgi:formylglycine-generating enzyme required for sulfatase activity